jgi:hypothetical protein
VEVDVKDFESEEQITETYLEAKQQADLGSLKAVPTLDYYEKTYGRSLQNDQKAVRVFRDYESSERIKRLQNELVYIKDNRVPSKTLHNILGRKREEKFGGYSKWAALMLMWASQKKR